MAVRVHLPEGPIKVDPGKNAEIKVGLSSSGGVVDSFRLDVLGEPGGWAELDPSIVKILPNTRREAKLTFRPKPETAPGAHPFAVRAVSSEGQGTVVEEGVVQVAVTDSISLDLHPRAAFAAKRTKQELQVINTGNAPVTVQLRATDPDGRAELDVQPEVLTVAPGTVGLATIRGLLPKGLENRERCRYKIEALNEDGNVERLDSELVYKSRGLLKWIAVVVLIFIVVAVALVVRRRNVYDSTARERTGGGATAAGPNSGGANSGGNTAGGANAGGANAGGANSGGSNAAGANAGGANGSGTNGGSTGPTIISADDDIKNQQPTRRLVWVAGGELWGRTLPDGSNQRLTGTPEPESEPDITTDGNAVTYVRGNRVAFHKFNNVTGGLSQEPKNHRFINDPKKPGVVSRPRFSNDGQYVSFVRVNGAQTELVVAKVDAADNDQTVGVLGAPASNGDPQMASTKQWVYRQDGIPYVALFSDAFYQQQPLSTQKVTELTLSRDAKSVYWVQAGVVHKMSLSGGQPSPLPGSSGDRNPRECQDGLVVVNRGKDVWFLQNGQAAPAGVQADAASCSAGVKS